MRLGTGLHTLLKIITKNNCVVNGAQSKDNMRMFLLAERRKIIIHEQRKRMCRRCNV